MQVASAACGAQTHQVASSPHRLGAETCLATRRRVPSPKTDFLEFFKAFARCGVNFGAADAKALDEAALPLFRWVFETCSGSRKAAYGDYHSRKAQCDDRILRILRRVATVRGPRRDI